MYNICISKKSKFTIWAKVKHIKLNYNYFKITKDSNKNEVLSPSECWDNTSRSFKSNERTSSKMNLTQNAIQSQMQNNKKIPQKS